MVAFTVSGEPLEQHATDLLVIPVLQEGKRWPVQPADATGELSKIWIRYDGWGRAKRVLFIGLGKEQDLDDERARKAFAAAVRVARDLKVKQFSVILQIPKLHELVAAAAVTEGIVLGDYRFEKYKQPEEGAVPVQGCTLLGGKGVERAVREAALICGNVNLARDMVNENADAMTTDEIARIARRWGAKLRLRVAVLEKPALQKLGMGLLLAVGSGSRYGPKLVTVEYRGNPQKKERIALIGKGITFDSGGLNLKPTGFLETMKDDMSGVAAVLGTIKSLAELKAKVNVVGVLPLAENMIGPTSYKPGDVYRSYSGKTVEIENTDAEGRLVLADAIAYAEQQLKPDLIVDIATLTGAAAAILGDYGGVIVGKDGRMDLLQEAGEETYERVWPLPLWEEFKEEVKGTISDVRNLGYNKKFAGTLMGAAFLQAFAEKVPLIHVDMASVAWSEGGRGYIPKYATGWGVRLLTAFCRKLAD
ncbi:MAG: leucyl aminopeptidase [Candidatus Aenigmarchaeota archaeon]|nr:leucyl aminopeptidase [Candidatus Aenigmarchaeota archaeon]